MHSGLQYSRKWFLFRSVFDKMKSHVTGLQDCGLWFMSVGRFMRRETLVCVRVCVWKFSPWWEQLILMQQSNINYALLPSTELLFLLWWFRLFAPILPRVCAADPLKLTIYLFENLVCVLREGCCVCVSLSLPPSGFFVGGQEGRPLCSINSESTDCKTL